LIVRHHCLNISLSIALLSFVGSGISQTYQVGSGGSEKPGAQTGQKQSPDQQLGWGSSIQNARLARAAELALQHGDHALALQYAQRASKAAPNDPQLWFLVGYAARLDSKYSTSADAYEHGLRLKPTSIDGLSGLAQTYTLMGRTAEAERMLKQVVAADPSRHNDLMALGDLYVRSGDYNSAVEWLNRAEHIEPAAPSELLLAICYEHLKQMDMASHYLELAKSRAPNNPDVERSLAEFYRESGDYSKAVDALLTIHNPKPDVVAELAYTYALDGKQEDAARLYIQAADALPRDLGLQLSAAQAQVSIGSIDSASKFLERASKIDPNYYRLHSIRGEIAQIQDRDSDAAQEYTLAVANLPASPTEGNLYGIQLHMNLVALYQNLDDAAMAHQQLAIAQTQIGAIDERGPNRAAFLRLRALIHMDAGQFEPALADMTASLALSPNDPNSLQLDGDVLIKMGRIPDAIAVFKKVLAIDPHSRFALTSLGYASRAAGNDTDAESYFNLLARNYPSSYVPYLALGDLYTSLRDYKKAEDSYSRGYALAPQNAMIVAGGMNAAIEAHDLPLAGTWLHRSTGKMAMVPQILREKERYFSFMGDSKQSADLGRQAIKLLPHERDVAVYLGYDLLHLNQWSELEALTTKYENAFPKDPDIPLLAGYVYKHNGQLEQAVKEFTEALSRDPNVITAHTNRGFVLNDLHQPARAAADFEQSLQADPKNVEAHMGLAFADLNLHRPLEAIKQTQLAEAVAGDSELVHTIRATAYGRIGLLGKSAAEYTAALKFDSTDGTLYLGLANIYFSERRYREAVQQLQTASKYLPENASIYALMARANANLHEREAALQDVQLADKYAVQNSSSAHNSASDPSALSDIYIATGQALTTLGDQKGAMEQFSKALQAPGSNRVSVRLAIASLMAQQNQTDDAERQVALAQLEVEGGDTPPPTGDQYIAAAGIFQQLHEYELSETYLEKAKSAGAPDVAVRIGMANSYLALGETRRAAAELTAVKQTDDNEADYQFLLAQAAVQQQEHHTTEALSTFAQASTDAGADQTAAQGLLQAGANEGLRVNSKLSVLSNVTVQPIFEDSTVYVLDSKLDSPSGPVPITDTAALPPPRSSIETNWISAFHLHLPNVPSNVGFFQLRNARGVISVPATNSIVRRNTTDYALNFGLTPTIHLGSNVITLNSGVQGTLRRDSLSPVELNQNLFRVFTYFTTTSFLNAVAADGYFAYETGPFSEIPLSGKYLGAAVNFRVGAPWSKTAMVTGWGVNDQKFTSQQIGNTEDYFTSTYIGLTHRFSSHLNAEAIMEDRRSWRIVPFSPLHSAISQAIRPAGTIDFSPNTNWDIQATGSYESTRGFHVYDAVQSGFAVSYTRPINRTFNGQTGKQRLQYPLRFSAGMQEETFFNFTQGKSQLRPYFSVTIF
jgi:tetratricopeptide (TPR) repeat protein